MYSLGFGSFYSILCLQDSSISCISSFCVDFHCDNMSQFTFLSIEDEHLGAL